MKVVAHPLVVAVALGLLGPGALAELRDDEESTEVVDASPEDGSSVPVAPEPVAPEELERAERAWLEVRGLGSEYTG